MHQGNYVNLAKQWLNSCPSGSYSGSKDFHCIHISSKQGLFIFVDREIISHRGGAEGRHGQVPETRQSEHLEDEKGSDLDSATVGLTEG
jgi:hypothetical protein